MEVFNEYLVGRWTVSNNITNVLSIASHKVRIYLELAKKESESIDLSSSKVAPKKPTHKSIQYINLQLWHAQKATSCKHNCNPIYNFH
jgi:hypothetical protein